MRAQQQTNDVTNALTSSTRAVAGVRPGGTFRVDLKLGGRLLKKERGYNEFSEHCCVPERVCNRHLEPCSAGYIPDVYSARFGDLIRL